MKPGSPWYPPSTIQTGNGDMFDWSEGARYKCTIHNSYTCREVQNLYRSGQDASIIHDMICAAQISKHGSFDIFVPISFEPDLEVIVELDYLDNLEGTASVYLCQESIPAEMWFLWHKLTGMSNPGSVGMVAPGDSVTTIVSMLDNHLVTLDIDVTMCPSSTHSFAQQMYLESNLETGAARRLEKWSRLLYGMCLACKTDPNATNFDDLIPEKAGKPF